MSRTNAPHMDIVKLEDKEDKLRTFIAEHAVALAQASKSAIAQDEILVIARSRQSPVAQAIAALVRDGQIAQPIRAIFAMKTHTDTAAGDDGFATRMLAHDLRLLDAHEQLVIGSKTSWIGDCMRRDPNKRDAYECFAADCGVTAGWARTSFERLWAASIAVADKGSSTQATPAVDACIAASTLAPAVKDPATSSQE